MMTFFTQESNGNKTFFKEVEVTKDTSEECLKEAIPLLQKISRDINDFLYLKGKELWFWNKQLTWEIK